jgi:hypothetical protein
VHGLEILQYLISDEEKQPHDRCKIQARATALSHSLDLSACPSAGGFPPSAGAAIRLQHRNRSLGFTVNELITLSGLKVQASVASYNE